MSERSRAVLALLLISPAPTVGVLAGVYFGMPVIWAFSKVWLFGFPLAWLLLADRERISWSPVKRGGLGVALLLGLVTMAVMWSAWSGFAREAIPAEKVQTATQTMGLDARWKFALACLYWITVNSLLEEYVYRWFIFRKCEIALGGGGGGQREPGEASRLVSRRGLAAIVLSAAIFVVHHTISMAAWVTAPWVNALASAGIFAGGAMWSWLYLRYRSLWPCYLAHACADIPIFTIGYFLLFG